MSRKGSLRLYITNPEQPEKLCVLNTAITDNWFETRSLEPRVYGEFSELTIFELAAVAHLAEHLALECERAFAKVASQARGDKASLEPKKEVG